MLLMCSNYARVHLIWILDKSNMQRDYEFALARSSVYYKYQGTLPRSLEGRCKEQHREY